MDALVEADRRGELALEAGVVDDVVVGQGLLDQQEVEGVELLERRQVVERVRRVGVDLERDVGVTLADRADDLDVVPRGDLELDPAVALVEVLVDQPEEHAAIALDPQADAREDLRPGAAEERGQRTALAPRQEVPAGHLQARLGEVVPLDRRLEPDELLDRRPLPAEESRREEVVQEVPAGLGRLRAVVRVRRARALAPADRAVGDDPHEDVVEVALAAGAGPERSHERQPHDLQVDPLDLHRGPAPSRPRTRRDPPRAHFSGPREKVPEGRLRSRGVFANAEDGPHVLIGLWG